MAEQELKTTLHVPAGTVAYLQKNNTKVLLEEGEYVIERGNSYCDGKVSRISHEGEVYYLTNDVFDDLYLSK
ncbi:hypothetical protein [uncultured Aquitalea sp.]|uniref:hypothetical protein n=1 Tax=uncultured Aquitalea sp. TaxID=540272 RepID=UPI0025DB9C16|nr:hypothetical protein [uncultured Aquitalea sp.]